MQRFITLRGSRLLLTRFNSMASANTNARITRTVTNVASIHPADNSEDSDHGYIGKESHDRLHRKIQMKIIDADFAVTAKTGIFCSWNHLKDQDGRSTEIDIFRSHIETQLRAMTDRELIELLNFYYPKYMDKEAFECALNMEIDMVSRDWCTEKINRLGRHAPYDFANFGGWVQRELRDRDVYELPEL